MRRITTWPIATVCALLLTSCGGGGGGGGNASRCDFPAASTTTATVIPVAGTPACGIDPVDYGVVGGIAVPPSLWNGSAACGTCFQVSGPAGTATAVAFDECPDCAGVDLSQAVADQVLGAGVSTGIHDVTVTPVPCDAAPQIKVVTTEASNAFYASLLVTGNRTPVAALRVGSSELARGTDNTFWSNWGGTTPVTITITDSFGESVEVANVPLSPQGTLETGKQFTSCD